MFGLPVTQGRIPTSTLKLPPSDGIHYQLSEHHFHAVLDHLSILRQSFWGRQFSRKSIDSILRDSILKGVYCEDSPHWSHSIQGSLLFEPTSVFSGSLLEADYLQGSLFSRESIVKTVYSRVYCNDSPFSRQSIQGSLLSEAIC